MNDVAGPLTAHDLLGEHGPEVDEVADLAIAADQAEPTTGDKMEGAGGVETFVNEASAGIQGALRRLGCSKLQCAENVGSSAKTHRARVLGPLRFLLESFLRFFCLL
jgi:hypothetical protein